LTLRIAERMHGIDRTMIRRIFDAAPPDAINLGLGEPDLPTPDVCALGGIAAIAEGRTGYSSTAGDPRLREAVAERYAPFTDGIDSVCITVGSQEAIFASCLALLDPGDELLYPDPGYPAYPVVARMLGAHAIAYPLSASRGFGLEPEDVLQRTTDRTRVVILCTPSNPTGAVAEPAALERLIGQLESRGIAWLSDEVYSGFVWDRKFVSPAAYSGGGGLVISGLSKGMSMTGWRIGWVVGPAEVVERITAAQQYILTCASSISQGAALAAFSPAGRRARRRFRLLFSARRELMGQQLSRVAGLRFTAPDGGFYYFVDARAHGDSLRLAARLLERQQVIVIPGEAFGSVATGWLRLSFAASRDEIRTGVDRIRRELGSV
jgi:aspartate/methionine/tyrosine aminotransferase